MKKHGLIFQVHVCATSYQKYTPRRSAGGHRIATWLRNQDWDVEVLDFAALFSLDELKEFARSRITSQTVFCGFSCFFGSWTDQLDQFAHWLKQQYPHVTLFTGGTAHPTNPCLAMDYHITGFGEHAVTQLLKVVTGNAVRGSLILDPKYLGQKRVINGNVHYPAFPMNDLSIYYEDRDYLDENEWLAIETARGCIFKCKFCNFPVLGVKGDYTQDQDRFYRNLQENYDRYGIRNYYIADETFNDRADKVRKFADAVERLDFDPFFTAFIRADLMVARPEDQQHLLRMNLLGHFYGIESTNPETLRVVGKGMHPDRLLPGILEAKKYFETHGRQIYRATISLIAGLPHETIQSLENTKHWVEANWKEQQLLWFPLWIPENINGQTLSEISIDPSKYGYTRYQGIVAEDNRLRVDLMPWQNQHMNQAQAAEFCRQFYERNRQFKITLSAFDLHVLCRPGFSIDQLLKTLETKASYISAQKFAQELVRRYKQKKLGL
jgi:hypothetical protein